MYLERRVKIALAVEKYVFRFWVVTFLVFF